MPGRTLSWPSTMTRSPGFTPRSTITLSPARSLVVITAASTLLPDPTSSTVCMFCNCWTALCGINMTPLRTSVSMRTRPNCPGSRKCRGLGKRACNSSVPVFESTSFTVFSTRPRDGNCVPSARIRVSDDCVRLPRFLKARYSDSVTLKRTHIGSTGTMVVNGCGEVALTSPPTGTSVSPISPLMGAWMVAYSVELVGAHGAAQRFDLALCRGDLRARGKPGLIHIGLIGANGCLGGIEHGLRRFQILFGGGILLHQRRQSFDVLLGLEQVGLRHREARFGMQHGDLLLREFKIGFALRQVPF